MAETRTGTGTLVRHPPEIRIRQLGWAPAWGTRDFVLPTDPQTGGLIDLLEPAGLYVKDAIELELPAAGLATGLRTGMTSEAIELEIDVPPGDSAVVLVERQGVYTWRYPDMDPNPSGLRGSAGLRFRLDPTLPDSASSDAGVRDPILDYVSDWLAGKIRAYVLRFAARAAVDTATNIFERGLIEGLVPITEMEPSAWLPGGLAVPSKAPHRILLLVHGTFSNTRGSFGSLTRTPSGRSFLAAAAARYNAVVGFDHATLAKNPLENAIDLYAALRGLDLPAGAEIDAVAYSRGGLVLRCLVERLLPANDWPLLPRRLVFIGCTNGGTGFAEPKNWKRLVDLYTNLALAGTRAVGLIPGLGTASALVGQTVESIGRFVQYIAEVAIDDGRVPGLSAMLPGGEFVAGLNSAPTAASVTPVYHVLTADFEPRADAPGFTAALRDFVLDRVADRLFSRANDLIVDCEAMSAFGMHQQRVAESWAFEKSKGVYHTVYFASSELPERLCDWLFNQPELAHRIATEFVELDAELNSDEALSSLAQLPPWMPVVIRRRHNGELLMYLLSVSEFKARPLLSGISPQLLTDALELREGDAVPVICESEAVSYKGKLLRVGRRVLVSPGVPLLPLVPSNRMVLLSAERVVGAFLDQSWADQILAIRSSAQDSKTYDRPTFDYYLRATQTDGVGHEDFDGAPVAPDAVVTLTTKDSTPTSDKSGTAEAPMPRAEAMTPTFECHFEAEMPSRPILGEPATLTVLLSREELYVDPEPTHLSASASVVEQEPIVVRAQPVRNCVIEGASVKTMPPPDPLRPRAVTFMVRGNTEGEAEVWIEAIQASRKLVTLPLRIWSKTSSRFHENSGTVR